MTDDELILASGRDPEALGALIGRFSPRVYAFLVRLCGRDAADDLFQEVWLKVREGSGSYRAGGRASSWIFKIAHNAAADAARRRRGAPAGEGDAGLDAFPEDRPGPAAELERGERRGRVEAAVAALPEEQRAVFLMREHGGMSFKEIAAAQGVPLGTALSRMNAALGKLRAALQEESRAS